MCELSDVTRWRAERSVRTAISVGMPLDAVAEASLLHKTIACGISDGGLDGTWTEEWSMPAGLQPAPRQAAMRAIRNADRVTEQQLESGCSCVDRLNAAPYHAASPLI